MFAVSEVFYSVQGEGTYCGTPMLFIRLAHCNVGKVGKGEGNMPLCTLYDGRTFTCDTDYKPHITLDDVKDGLEEQGIEIDQFVPHGFDKKNRTHDDCVWATWYMENLKMHPGLKHVCITGGEPFMEQNLEFLYFVCLFNYSRLITTHFETSCTKYPEKFLLEDTSAYGARMHFVGAPKRCYNPKWFGHLDEVKFLIDQNTDITMLEDMTNGLEQAIFIQPVNKVNEVDHENVHRCMKLLEKHPNWRLSTQMHKLIGVE